MAGRDTMKTLGRAAGVSLLTATALVAVQVLRIADQTAGSCMGGKREMSDKMWQGGLTREGVGEMRVMVFRGILQLQSAILMLCRLGLGLYPTFFQHDRVLVMTFSAF